MPDANDMDLVRDFARNHSEAAFTELVRRHLNLVYSVARRCTGSDGDAEDVTQAVFVILARKAAGLRARTALTGWLYETTRYTAACVLRTNARRHAREQEAYMQSTLADTDTADAWSRLAPHLEAAMAQLGERDRTLLALRFYENKSGPEAAALLGIAEAAAHKRTARALEKLRKFFTQRGVALSAATIAGAVSANSVQAAPAGLVKTISVVAVAKGAAAGTSTITLVKGTLKIMAWTKLKTVVVVGIAAILTAGTTSIAFHHNPAAIIDLFLFSRTKELSSDENTQYARWTGTTPEQAVKTFFEACGREDWTEVAKFWNEPGTRYPLDDKIKKDLGGLQLISLGKPFWAWPRNGSQKFGGVFVPYEIQFKNGEVKKFQLSVRCDNPDKRWYVDGGL